MANQQQDSRVNPVQVQKFLGGVDYPCSKDDLIKLRQERRRGRPGD